MYVQRLPTPSLPSRRMVPSLSTPSHVTGQATGHIASSDSKPASWSSSNSRYITMSGMNVTFQENNVPAEILNPAETEVALSHAQGKADGANEKIEVLSPSVTGANNPLQDQVTETPAVYKFKGARPPPAATHRSASTCTTLPGVSPLQGSRRTRKKRMSFS